YESITLSAVTDDDRAKTFAPPEKWLQAGARRVRVVEVNEKLELHVARPTIDLRFRVTLLPSPSGQPLRVNIKGLNCFVAKPGGRPTPAIVADCDGAADFVSTSRELIGAARWSFGRLRVTDRGADRVFDVDGAELVIPSPAGSQALALDLASPSFASSDL